MIRKILIGLVYHKDCMLFKQNLVSKILAGKKTQTRRCTQCKRGARVYKVSDRVGIEHGYKPPVAYIIITNRRKETIGAITEEDATKIGFSSVEEFKQT